MRISSVVFLIPCAACSSPDVQRKTGPPPADDAAASVETQPETGAVADREASGLDGFVASLCDRDGDGFRAMGPPCDGTDCDDGDPRAHPSADFSYDSPVDPTLGDWNCDSRVEYELVGWVIDCSSIGPSACGSAKGFVGFPDCGERGAYITCAVSGNACVIDTSTVKRQACR